ncbi:EPIDERMAL PATTERNING FACTOR protein 3 [Spatholobus suberectus]|nr:EPIDERMAL PATTERNING FACTOR protein 3 [Spatholobus suberectus]
MKVKIVGVFNSDKKTESLACEAKSLGQCKVRRPFLPAQKEALQSPPPYTIESKRCGFMGIEGRSETMQEAYDGGVSKIGSSPPSCEHKCYGCVPCEAIQVPSTSTRRSHLGIQYANYEPESWKCKCGPSFYSP